jgi:dTDP-4-dehydrorhamnose reductase
MNSTLARSLLVGASGQIGGQIVRLTPSEKLLVSSRRPESDQEIQLDLASIETVQDAERLLDGHALDAIYCIAGMTNVEGCEDYPDLAYNTNSRGPETLAHVAAARAIPFVYFSTEYIFDGFDGPYSEDHPANPLSAYGKSKWDGEQAVLGACKNALILRTTVVYGNDTAHKNYAYSVIRSLAGGKRMRVPQDQISTPTYNLDLAAATLSLVNRGACGTYHLCGPERMDRVEFARRVASNFGLDTSLIDGVPTSVLGQKAVRPLSAGLSINKLRRLHPDLRMRTVAEGLEDSRGNLEAFLRSCARLA